MLIQPSADHTYTWANFFLADIRRRFYWVFDLEATGIDYTSERVIQIGGVAVETGRVVEDSAFTSFVRPDKPLPEKVQRLTGISQEDIDSAPNFSEVLALFLDSCQGRILVTQCGHEFDYPLLDAECQRHSLVLPDLPRLDTKAVFAYLHPDVDATFSTDYLVNYYGIDRGGLKRHDALGDALLIARVWCAELEEARRMGVDTISVVEPIRVHRFVLPPL